VGWKMLSVLEHDPLLQDLGDSFPCFVSHSDEVREEPDCLRHLVRSSQCESHAFVHRSRPVWGVQFHPELRIEEAEKLVHWRAACHPEHGYDVARILGAQVDPERVSAAIFKRFIELCAIR